jgi:hypothetical protein
MNQAQSNVHQSSEDAIAQLRAALSCVFEAAVDLHEKPHPLMSYRDALGYRLGTAGHAYHVLNTTEAIKRMDELEIENGRLRDRLVKATPHDHSQMIAPSQLYKEGIPGCPACALKREFADG